MSLAFVYMAMLVFVQHNFTKGTTSTLLTDTTEWTCPEGWHLKLQSCYRRGTTWLVFSEAVRQCNEWESNLRNIKNEAENNLFSDSTNGKNYWLGIRRINDKLSYLNGGTIQYSAHWSQSKDGDRNAFSSWGRMTRNCVVWHSSTKHWQSVDCHQESFNYICQKPAVCVPGRFGDSCSHECHCKDGTCDTISGFCQHGCQPGWTGTSCDIGCVPGRFGVNCSWECHCERAACNATSGFCQHGCKIGWTGTSCNVEKFKADAKFYCLKIRNIKTMIFRVNQRGTKYRSVSAIDKKGNAVRQFNKVIFGHFEDGRMATLKVWQRRNGKFKPECGEQMISADVVTWKFKFQEFPVTSSAYDVIFEVSCDFTKADTLQRLATLNAERLLNTTTTLTESKMSVSFEIVDPASDQPLTTAKLGQQVRLQMQLRNRDVFDEASISPYNCSVSTEDGEHSVIFLDQNGCPCEDPQVLLHSSEHTQWRSDIFESFTFPGYDKVNFQCHFHVCFKEDVQHCRNMCAHSRKRKNRKLRKRNRSSSEFMKKTHELGTTITIGI